MRIGTLLLASAMVGGLVVGACGGGEGATPPQVPSVTPSGSSSTTAPTPTGVGTAPAPPSSTEPPVAAKVPMKPIAASAMAAELKEIGLDPKNLPALNKMEPEKLRRVMKTFTKALGVQCKACHDPNDFRAWTDNKRIAVGMWNEFTRKLTFEDGSLLYCDSCHQGSLEYLDRKDKKALSAWMDANLVSKLKRVDKKENSCDTCHGDPFEPLFLPAWAKKK